MLPFNHLIRPSEMYYRLASEQTLQIYPRIVRLSYTVGAGRSSIGNLETLRTQQLLSSRHWIHRQSQSGVKILDQPLNIAGQCWKMMKLLFDTSGRWQQQEQQTTVSENIGKQTELVSFLVPVYIWVTCQKSITYSDGRYTPTVLICLKTSSRDCLRGVSIS